MSRFERFLMLEFPFEISLSQDSSESHIPTGQSSETDGLWDQEDFVRLLSSSSFGCEKSYFSHTCAEIPILGWQRVASCSNLHSAEGVHRTWGHEAFSFKSGLRFSWDVRLWLAKSGKFQMNSNGLISPGLHDSSSWLQECGVGNDHNDSLRPLCWLGLKAGPTRVPKVC